jgi:hypothetical protein
MSLTLFPVRPWQITRVVLSTNTYGPCCCCVAKNLLPTFCVGTRLEANMDREKEVSFKEDIFEADCT